MLQAVHTHTLSILSWKPPKKCEPKEMWQPIAQCEWKVLC